MACDVSPVAMFTFLRRSCIYDNALSYIMDVTHRHHAESTMAMMVILIMMSMIILNWHKDTDEDIVGVYDNANVRILSWSRMVTSPSPS